MGAPVAIDAPADPIPAGAKDRRLAAVVHLGPLVCGLPVTLLLLVADDTKTPFCRLHLRHAVRVQLQLLAVIAVILGVTVAFPDNQYWWLATLIAWVTTTASQVPNVARALGARPPQRLSRRIWRRVDGARAVDDKAAPGPGGR